jgi:hypothetical protein
MKVPRPDVGALPSINIQSAYCTSPTVYCRPAAAQTTFKKFWLSTQFTESMFCGFSSRPVAGSAGSYDCHSSAGYTTLE